MKLLLAFLVLIAGLQSVRAANQELLLDAIEDRPNVNSFCHDLHFTLSDEISSRYWGTIVGGIFYPGGAVNFTNFTVTKDCPGGTYYALVGMINPLDTLKWDDRGGTEYYAGIGRTFDLWKKGPKDPPLVRLNLFVLYDAISKIKHFDDDVVQQFVRIEFPRTPFADPYLELYHWNATGTKSPPVGFFGRAGLNRQQPLGFSFRDTPLNLGIDLSAGYSGEIFHTSEGLAYWRAIFSTDIQITKKFKVTPAIIFQLPGHGQERGRAFVEDPEIFGTLTATWTW